MDNALRAVLLAGTVIYLAIIFMLLKKNKLSVRFSLIWLASGGVLLVFAAFPYVVYVLRDIFHMVMPVNLVFTLLFCFVLLLLLTLSVAASGFSERIKGLAQANAILEKRVRVLEAKLDELSSSKGQ